MQVQLVFHVSHTSIHGIYCYLSYEGFELSCSVIMLLFHDRYESSYGLLGNEYFMHASGSLYALSSEVVGAIATTNNDRLVVYLFFPSCRVKAYDI